MLHFIRAPSLSPDVFQSRVLAALVASPDVERVEAVDTFTLNLWHSGEVEPKAIYLDDAWAAYSRSSVFTRSRLFREIIAAFADRPPVLDPDQIEPDRLVPLVRHRDCVSLMPDCDDPIWSQDFVGDLVVLVGYDHERSLLVPSWVDLLEAGWPPETALAKARENLETDVPPLAIAPGSVGTATFELDGLGWLLPTMLLHEQAMEAMAKSLEARSILVSLPGCEPIFFADADRPGAIGDMAKTIHSETDIDHPQTRMILRHRIGEPLEPVAQIDDLGRVTAL